MMLALEKLYKVVLEYALFTKSYWSYYNTNERDIERSKLSNGVIVEYENIWNYTKERKFFRLDFFLSIRNKTIAELMNIPLNTVKGNTICEEYQYNKGDDEGNKEKAFMIAKVMCKNILNEISFDDAINILLINKKIFTLDGDIENLVSLSGY